MILLFSDFYNILSFNWLLLMRKSYNYEVISNFCFQIVLRNSLDPDLDSRIQGLLDPDPDWDIWLDPDPDSTENGSETLLGCIGIRWSLNLPTLPFSYPRFSIWSRPARTPWCSGRCRAWRRWSGASPVHWGVSWGWPTSSRYSAPRFHAKKNVLRDF